MIAEYLIKFDEEIKSCDVCPFCKTNDDLNSEDYRHMYCGYPHMGEFVTDYIACRHPDCPLKEVPSHGRLGDLDALKTYLDNTIKEATEIGLPVTSEYLMGLIDDAIKNAPTVLEAST